MARLPAHRARRPLSARRTSAAQPPVPDEALRRAPTARPALLGCALVSAVFALLFGIPYAWGRTLEASATAVFGTWFIACLLLAFRAIRGDNVPQHRRWMIRAFAVGVGIGTIRIWVGIFEGIEQGMSGGTTSSAPDHTMFGVAFWLGFSMHVAIGEWWLRRTPALSG